MARPALVWLLAGGALLGFSSFAQAQEWYSCRDAKGTLLRGQFVPEGCVGEICKTNPNTGARTCTQPAESPAQRAQREAAQKRERECAKLVKDHVRDDLRFLDKYWNDDIIEDERARTIVEQQRRIDESERLLQELTARRNKLAQEAEFFGPKHTMPAQLKSDIEHNRSLLQAQERVAAVLQKGMHLINEKYDAMRERRRRLLEKGSTPPKCADGMAQ